MNLKSEFSKNNNCIYMKNIFFILIAALLFVFVANSPTFANESDYDPVKFEQAIYCDCCAVASIFDQETEKEYKHLAAVPIRQNETPGIFFKNGICLSRDNTETEKESILKKNSK